VTAAAADAIMSRAPAQTPKSSLMSSAIALSASSFRIVAAPNGLGPSDGSSALVRP
jgi:hypothetical protein